MMVKRPETRMSDQVNYKVVEGWEQLPKGFAHRDVAGVADDQEDGVYLICRGENPVIVYDRQGNFLRTWGKGDFSMRAHGIYVAPNGTIFATDDGNHTVRQFTPEGRLLVTMGTLNGPSDTGYDGKTTGSISRTGPPFNRPTNVAIGSRGNIYISDGYGNSRVHMFSPTGQLKPRGASPETVLASSGCRTGSPVHPTVGASCATVNRSDFRSSAPTATSSSNGPTRNAPHT